MESTRGLIVGVLCILLLAQGCNAWKVFEAEGAHASGSIKQGGSHVEFHPHHNDNGRITFSVYAPADGIYPVEVTFASGYESRFSLHANGHPLKHITLPAVQKWEVYDDEISLREGHNTLSFRMERGEDVVRMDHVKIRSVQAAATRGATQPFYDIEAENANYNGVLIGPDRTYRSLPSEAQGRKAVQITNAGQSVEFTLTSPCNAMVVRYSIPDSSDGTGLTALLGVYVNGAATLSMNVTSKYSWIYGIFPFTNNVSQGLAHHFYDDARVMFSSTYPVGTKMRLAPVSKDITFTIDVVSFYTVPAPYTMPASGYVSVTSFGADPSGLSDSTNAFLTSFANPQKQSVWIPRGRYLVRQPFTVTNITIRGAGNWYTTLFTDVPAGVGFFGIFGGYPSNNVGVYDLAINGATTSRDDPHSHDWGVGGQFSNTIFQNLWIEHTKVGFWFGSNVPYSNVLVTGCTVRNTMADGINLYRGATNVLVEQSVVRNTGDDCLAMFPSYFTNTGCTFRFNTVGLPMQANAIAVYGGINSTVTDNIVYDVVVEGGAFQVANRYDSIPLNGTTIFARNSATRGGAFDRSGGMRYGSIVVWPENSPIFTTVLFDTMTLVDSLYSALLFVTRNVSNVFFRDIQVNAVGTAVIEVQNGVSGSVYITGLVATNMLPSQVGVTRKSCSPPFLIQLGPNNVGWNDSSCAPVATVTTAIPPPILQAITSTLATSTTKTLRSSTDLSDSSSTSDSSSLSTSSSPLSSSSSSSSTGPSSTSLTSTTSPSPPPHSSAATTNVSFLLLLFFIFCYL